MDITKEKLESLYHNFNTAFNDGFKDAPTYWQRVATLIPSVSSFEDYGWLGQVPGVREWIGDRVINALAAHKYSITNKNYELTISVDRQKIEDGHEGIYSPLFEMMGDSAAKHPDEMVFSLLPDGFSTACYDGQYFFDTDHPVVQADGTTASVSNMQTGAGNPWFLLDTSRPLKPLIFQQRKKPEFAALDDPSDPNVFMAGNYLYGVESRDNVGFGFWQMAFGSKAALTVPNFESARGAVTSFKKDYGMPLAIRPDLLVCGTSNESAARLIVDAMLSEGGGSNIWYKSVDLLVVPWLE